MDKRFVKYYKERYFMANNNRSVGQSLMAFLRGFISIIFILIIIVSVGINIIFYNDNSAPKINLFGMNSTFFVMNNNDISEISQGSLVRIDNEKTDIHKGSFIFCTVGSSYKTILYLADVTENENGTFSYTVTGHSDNSTLHYTIPDTKINGLAVARYDMYGDIIAFTKSIPGIILLMAVPSFLLIVMSIFSIRKNKSEYEDALLEADIMAEELRKAKQEKQAKKKDAKQSAAENGHTGKQPVRKKPAPAPAPEAETPVIAETEPPKAEPEEHDDDYLAVESEISRKATEIKNALHNQTINEAGIDMTMSAKIPSKTQTHDDVNLTANEILSQISPEMQTTIEPQHPVYREIENPAPRKPQTVARPSVKPAAPKPAFARPVYKETPKPAPAPKKDQSLSKKSFDAQSIDDLIKAIEDEKKKLD